MAYICEKPSGSCPSCSHYRYDEDKGRNACYASLDQKAEQVRLNDTHYLKNVSIKEDAEPNTETPDVGITFAELQSLPDSIMECCKRNNIDFGGIVCLDGDTYILLGAKTMRRINIQIITKDGKTGWRLLWVDGITYTCNEYREKFLKGEK